MPIYEYCCPSCDTKFDLLRSFSNANAPALCPKCKHESRRLVSAFASFSKDSSTGATTAISGGGGGCSGCASGNCASCH
ncbi:MAG: zinc ribbon domain-containing protein [Chloroflexi bacterium]|nr:zinc ribbon domain-containing protein [Chloroflexota bacterium]